VPKTVGKIQLFMGPHPTGAPDDLGAAVIGFIDGARKTLDIAVQELDAERIGRAVLRARARGVRVRLVLEQDYLVEEEARANPWKAGGPHEPNRAIRDAILRSASRVWADFNPSIFHQKFVVRDGTAVLTGSTNFTDTGITKNLNHVVIVKDKRVAIEYTREFREIMEGRFGRRSEAHGPKPKRAVVSDVPVKVLFAPEHGPEMEIMKQMLKAKRRIDFAIFTFAQSSGIDDTMVTLQEKGLAVRGVFDGGQANQKWAATRLVKAAGIPVWVVKKKAPVGKLHHKLMVVDEQLVIAGSFNYTAPANQVNDENIIVLGDLDTTRKSSIRAQRRLARYALDEIDRIIQDHAKKV